MIISAASFLFSGDLVELDIGCGGGGCVDGGGVEIEIGSLVSISSCMIAAVVVDACVVVVGVVGVVLVVVVYGSRSDRGGSIEEGVPRKRLRPLSPQSGSCVHRMLMVMTK